MNKKNLPVEFVFQLFALIIAIIVVHAFYVSVVRPNAAEVIEEQNMQAAADPDFVRERSVWVLIKDFEQEACFILMFWALAIMGYKAVKFEWRAAPAGGRSGAGCGRHAHPPGGHPGVRAPGAGPARRPAADAAAESAAERTASLQFDAQYPGRCQQYAHDLRIRGGSPRVGACR